VPSVSPGAEPPPSRSWKLSAAYVADFRIYSTAYIVEIQYFLFILFFPTVVRKFTNELLSAITFAFIQIFN